MAVSAGSSAGSGVFKMPKDVKVTLRFYSGQDDDLITWLESLHVSYGKKGEAIKDVLRQGLGPTDSDKPALTAANPVSKQEEMPPASAPKKLSIDSEHW
jgi:hypothetical protein